MTRAHHDRRHARQSPPSAQGWKIRRTNAGCANGGRHIRKAFRSRRGPGGPGGGRALRSIVIEDGEFGRGYGLPTPSSEAARALAQSEGITLDVTYTSKTLASLLRAAEGARRGQKLLFWNTLSSAPLAPFLKDAPEAPEEFVQLLTLES